MRITLAILLVLSLAAGHWYHNYDLQEKKKSYSKEINSHLDKIYHIEKDFIANLPIYEDYGTAKKEKELRKYLLPHHIQAAKKSAFGPVNDVEHIKKLVGENKLAKIEADKDALFFFYNVPDSGKYLTLKAADGLKMIAYHFQEILRKKADLPEVKLAVSSMLRTKEYHSKLKTSNENAAYISSHSYGVSFDLFYDDYFINFPEPQKTEDGFSNEIIDRLNYRFGFLAGDALRRQLKSMLMETLIELQAEGKIYAIIEKNQRCFHVTVLK
ncbi:MAG: DUF5715 family protein [Spirochaetia bacterium]|nr:DUF5715 family protein [Spirochaetia bacterium]